VGPRADRSWSTLGRVPPELTDGVIVLSAMTLDDVGALVAGEDDDIVARLTRAPATPATAEQYIRACAADWRDDWYRAGTGLTWGIRDAVTSHLAGTAEVHLRFSELEVGAANLSYGVFPRWRGRRYGARAVALMCHFLATETAASLAVLRIDRDNAPSLRVAEQCGFRPSQQLAPANASMLWFSRSLSRS
jgi:RimJ/RimL family protein N-acetyltransferase